MSASAIQMSHSLQKKLVVLEKLLQKAIEVRSLPELGNFLTQTEKIVTCESCHQAYRGHPNRSTLDDQIDRILSQACQGFHLIEREAAAELCDYAPEGRYIKNVSLSALKEAKTLELNHRSKVLFIGCGARPVSCHALATQFGCDVVGIDNDPECIEMALEYAHGLAQSSRLSFLLQDGCQADLEKVTHVIIASLVEDKANIIEHLGENSDSSTKVCVRFGEGLHRLINYPLPEFSFQPWASSKVDLDPYGLYQSLYITRV